MKPLFRLGLTGSIGMGKTTTAAMFAEEGVPVWDADAVVHRLYARGGPAGPALEAAFPGALGSDGAVDRGVLRDLVADNPAVLDQINAIVHPMVAVARAEFLKQNQGLVLLDIPLLFEAGLEGECDAIAVVTTDAATQRVRVLARGTMTEADFEAILSRQMPDAEKRKRADYVIPTDTLDGARRTVKNVIADIKGRQNA